MHTKNKYLLLRNVLIDVNSCSLVFQGSQGIRQWLINLCTSPIMIRKITPFVNNNQSFKRLDTEPTNQNSIKVSKVVKPPNKKML